MNFEKQDLIEKIDVLMQEEGGKGGKIRTAYNATQIGKYAKELKSKMRGKEWQNFRRNRKERLSRFIRYYDILGEIDKDSEIGTLPVTSAELLSAIDKDKREQFVKTNNLKFASRKEIKEITNRQVQYTIRVIVEENKKLMEENKRLKNKILRATEVLDE